MTHAPLNRPPRRRRVQATPKLHKLPETGRSGRNLPAAISVAVALVLLLIVSLVFHPAIFLVLTCAVCLLGLYELTGAFAKANVSLVSLPVYFGAVGILVSTYNLGIQAGFFALNITIAAIVVSRILEGGGRAAVRDIAVSTFAVAYVPFLASFVILLLTESMSVWPVITFIAITAANDTGGLISGVLWGKHPMCPGISPNKTWEGFAGSVILSVAIAVGAVLAMHGSWWWGLLLGVLTAGTATVGDLGESLLKRDLNIKDMGHLLPGHGGVMDRLDSLLITAPMCYLVLQQALGW